MQQRPVGGEDEFPRISQDPMAFPPASRDTHDGQTHDGKFFVSTGEGFCLSTGIINVGFGQQECGHQSDGRSKGSIALAMHS